MLCLQGPSSTGKDVIDRPKEGTVSGEPGIETGAARSPVTDEGAGRSSVVEFGLYKSTSSQGPFKFLRACRRDLFEVLEQCALLF